MDLMERRKITENYLGRVLDLESQHDIRSSAHFYHVGRSMVANMKIMVINIEREIGGTEEVYDDMELALDAYLTLIDQFEQFRDSEMNKFVGHYNNATRVSLPDYIWEAADKLIWDRI